MKAEETIQSMFDHYPTIFQDRKSVLDHLFLVIGNGYKWFNGELVDKHDEILPINSLVEGKAFQYTVIKTKGDYRKKYLPNTFELAKEKGLSEKALTQIKEFEDRYNSDSTPYVTFTEWYPISDYSAINNIPEDITEDWRKLVEEFKEMYYGN